MIAFPLYQTMPDHGAASLRCLVPRTVPLFDFALALARRRVERCFGCFDNPVISISGEAQRPVRRPGVSCSALHFVLTTPIPVLQASRPITLFRLELPLDKRPQLDKI